MKEILHLQVPAKLEELNHIESELEKLAESEGWDAGLVYQIHLVLEELAVNTANYGYPDGVGAEGGVIDIRISSDQGSLTIQYSDNGTAFNPFEEAPSPDIDASVEERRIGGLGVHFVRSMMDEVGYRREGDRNHITLAKRKDN